jgi:deazaflavin-dependent oxidoreductase (nitroreductase family)
MKATGSGHGPRQPDIRQRVGAALFRAIGPLMRLLLRRGLPTGPNVLLVVRGRVSGRPYATPVAMWERGDRRFVQASFGEVNWVLNLRGSGEAVIRRGSWSLAVHATELEPAEAGRLMYDALAGFRRRRLLRLLLGPTVRPPAAILHRYRHRVDERLEDYVAEARLHPLFELRPVGVEGA